MMRRWSYLAGVTLVALCLAAPGYRAGAQSPAPAPPDPFEHAGVVDLEAVLARHPGAQQLQAIDQQIAAVEADLASSPAAEIDPEVVKKRLEQAQKKLVEGFRAEVEGTQARLSGRKAAIEGTLRAEADAMRHELEAYAASLKKEALAGGGPAAAPRPMDARGQQKLSNLMLASQVTAAQRRRELEHQVEASLAAEKRALESESSRRLAEVMQANQAEKLQIQLDLQTTTDEEERKKLQERMAALSAAEDEKRATVRSDLAARYEKARAREMARAEAELRAYKDKLDRDVRRQVGQQMGQVQGSGAVPVGGVARLQRLMEARQAQVRARFEARKDALMAELQAESQAAQSSLKKRQAGLQGRMKQEQKRIIAEFVKKSQKVSGGEQKRRKHMAEELADLRKQRDRIYLSLVDQIRSDVKPVADAEHLGVVLCGVRVNVACKDLTRPLLDKIAR